MILWVLRLNLSLAVISAKEQIRRFYVKSTLKMHRHLTIRNIYSVVIPNERQVYIDNDFGKENVVHLFHGTTIKPSSYFPYRFNRTPRFIQMVGVLVLVYIWPIMQLNQSIIMAKLIVALLKQYNSSRWSYREP